MANGREAMGATPDVTGNNGRSMLRPYMPAVIFLVLCDRCV